MPPTLGKRLRLDTTVRSYRTSLALYERAKARAEREGTTVNDVLNRALERYAGRAR